MCKVRSTNIFMTMLLIQTKKMLFFWQYRALNSVSSFYHLTHKSLPQPCFALTIFQVGSHVFAWVSLRLQFSTYSLCIAEITDTSWHLLVCGDGGLTNFLSRLASNCNPLNLHLLSSWTKAEVYFVSIKWNTMQTLKMKFTDWQHILSG
jgi:hypothetical protein